ncbi:hypothetical protein IFR04_004713 [Cadophora malorum]|uniref:Phosphate transporter n=1 Tax=Cadophora malorum TaxID=108018 RepID=A0A8H7WCB0_9HELO|nr:hypothetical protein IFR04_004713 [Cadophora malorum]
MAVLQQYSWIIALISIAFCVSSFGNGANDVANSYATSVAARTLTMPQVGILAMVTEFVGAVALGSRVTGTIKNNIIDIKHFTAKPATLILIMGCTEFGSAAWLIIATKSGFPVSTTQTVVGALVGAGIAAGADVSWGWKKGSVSQVAASWAIAPLIAAGFSAILFGTIKFGILNRKDPFKWAMRLTPFYYAFTAAVLALFMVVEVPNGDSLEEFGVGKICGIVFGTFFGVLGLAYIFFIPYFHRRIVAGDTRIRSWHIPLGPLLWRDNPPLYWPSKRGAGVKDYSGGAKTIQHTTATSPHETPDMISKSAHPEGTESPVLDSEKNALPSAALEHAVVMDAREKYLGPTEGKKIYHPKRAFAYVNYIFWRGVSKDCVTFDAEHLHKTHAHAAVYDNNVEHLWTYAQVASAMMMSIAHGSNDVANAVAPWVAAYQTYMTGKVTSKGDTPVWILVIAGFLLGTGFWFFGYHIIRSLGNRITRVSPTRGYSIELGAAITVLLASQLALPVSTTQCLTGATVGVALMNFDAAAVNWKQLGFIFMGWVFTLPAAGLIAGLLTAMALNTPHF